MGAHLAAFMLMWSPELVHTQGQVGTGGAGCAQPQPGQGHTFLRLHHYKGAPGEEAAAEVGRGQASREGLWLRKVQIP